MEQSAGSRAIKYQREDMDVATSTQPGWAEMIRYPTVVPLTLLFTELTVSFLTRHLVLIIQLRGKKWDVFCQRTTKKRQAKLHGQYVPV